jgi:uracil-DNA glycosylase family 4
MQQDAHFRRIYRQVHAGHPGCLRDEWLGAPCADAGGPVARPIAWSRRNGPWRRHEMLWVGAAPGNAGGRGAGDLGAHATRIPFGGDIAGANLDVLLGSIGSSRNDSFITAALNHLPQAGGGEPTPAEIAAPVGTVPSSIHLLRDTIIAVGPQLIVALGNVAARACFAAFALRAGDLPRLPTLQRLQRAGLTRNVLFHVTGDPAVLSADFRKAWGKTWNEEPELELLLLTHPSGQNMSPFARPETAFHQRMIEARDALRAAVSQRFARDLPSARPPLPGEGIYALPEWRERIGPHHARLDALWRARGV